MDICAEMDYLDLMKWGLEVLSLPIDYSVVNTLEKTRRPTEFVKFLYDLYGRKYWDDTDCNVAILSKILEICGRSGDKELITELAEKEATFHSLAFLFQGAVFNNEIDAVNVLEVIMKTQVVTMWQGSQGVRDKLHNAFVDIALRADRVDVFEKLIAANDEFPFEPILGRLHRLKNQSGNILKYLIEKYPKVAEAYKWDVAMYDFATNGNLEGFQIALTFLKAQNEKGIRTPIDNDLYKRCFRAACGSGSAIMKYLIEQGLMKDLLSQRYTLGCVLLLKRESALENFEVLFPILQSHKVEAMDSSDLAGYLYPCAFYGKVELFAVFKKLGWIDLGKDYVRTIENVVIALLSENRFPIQFLSYVFGELDLLHRQPLPEHIQASFITHISQSFKLGRVHLLHLFLKSFHETDLLEMFRKALSFSWVVLFLQSSFHPREFDIDKIFDIAHFVVTRLFLEFDVDIYQWKTAVRQVRSKRLAKLLDSISFPNNTQGITNLCELYNGLISAKMNV
jgi:hypothetical protein